MRLLGSVLCLTHGFVFCAWMPDSAEALKKVDRINKFLVELALNVAPLGVTATLLPLHQCRPPPLSAPSFESLGAFFGLWTQTCARINRRLNGLTV